MRLAPGIDASTGAFGGDCIALAAAEAEERLLDFERMPSSASAADAVPINSTAASAILVLVIGFVIARRAS